MAVVAGFLLLGLVFGGRLWAHHFSSMPVWFATALALALAVLWRIPRAGPVLAVAICASLVVANLLTWRTVERDLTQTGGRGLFSDAIVRFAEDVSRQPHPPLVAAPDWGVMMPLAMLGEGAVPIVGSVDPGQLRSRLCAGENATIAIVVANGADRLGPWESAVGWPDPVRRGYAQRDGTIVLETTTWSGDGKVADGLCGAP